MDLNASLIYMDGIPSDSNIPTSIMRPVTRIEVEGLPFLSQPTTEPQSVVPSPPEPNSKPGEGLHFTRLAKGNAPPSPVERSGKIIRGQPRALSLPKIIEGKTAASDLIVRKESPWDTCEKIFECDLAGTVAVCVRRSGRRALCAVRQYPNKQADKIIETLRSIHHKNVVSVVECFHTSNSLYTLGKHQPLTLDHIVACKAFPDQQQLAAIMSQFLDGLSYLIAKNVQHTSLNCSSILMNLDGEVQIARIDCCSIRPPGKIQSSDLAPVGRVMMELMQKYVKDEGVVGLDNLDRWRSSSAAIEFLSATTSASSLEELKKRLLTETRWATGDLIGLAWFALISARTFYSYTPPSD
ncbi:hypothetical protein BJY01DRAFT_173128 [Aspergillus pseudoustus]|uniref:Protein kinase domain-containing protein n=1 Tax=Aspergillus pseudoustus TaxID=1810923 RepID=A0ABR4K3N4_9EURO